MRKECAYQARQINQLCNICLCALTGRFPSVSLRDEQQKGKVKNTTCQNCKPYDYNKIENMTAEWREI